MSRDLRYKSWFKRNPKKALLCINLFGLLLIEIILRVGFISFFSFGETMDGIRHNVYTHHDYIPKAIFIKRPGRFDTFAPVLNEINSYGIRGPEITEKKGYRVLNVGDSFVQADEVSFEDTFGEKLNGYFKNSIEFISQGVSSWAPTTEFSWIYHKGLKLQPDEINLFLCVNDFYRAKVFAASDESYRRQAVYEGRIPVGYRIGRARSLFKKMFMKIKIVKLCVIGYKQIRSKSKWSLVPRETILLAKAAPEWPDDLKKSVAGTVKVIADLNEFLLSKGVKLNVLTAPFGFAWKNETVYGRRSAAYGWAEDYVVGQAGIEDYLKNKLKMLDINYIDLREGFNRQKAEHYDTLLFNETDGHWNKNGHAVVFEILKTYYAKELAAGERI